MKSDSPSRTAYVIARSIVYVSGDPEVGGLIPARAVEISAEFVRAHSRLAFWLLTVLRPLSRLFISPLERLSVPGIQLHYVLRKRFIEDEARKAVRNGAGQIVIVGGGFDTLAIRLHQEFPSVDFIEIDHPATQQIKRQTAEVCNRVGDNMHFLPADLSCTSLEEELLTYEHYSESEKSFFICEGVLMYLQPEEIETLFSFIRNHSGAHSSFVFTFMELDNDQICFRNSSALVEKWLSLRSEVFTWGIPRQEVRDFLASVGFDLVQIATDETLRARYIATANLEGLPLAQGECICVAEIKVSQIERNRLL